jgi:TonB family protein
MRRIVVAVLVAGTLALLLQYVTDPRAATRWGDALRSTDPNVRATAARLLYVSRVAAALRLLRQALSVETDRGAAIEIARAVSAFGDAADDDTVLGAAGRLSASGIAVTFAEERRSSGLGATERMINLKLTRDNIQRIVSALVGRDASALNAAAAAILTSQDSGWWDALLATAVQQRIDLSQAQLEAALRSSSSEIRDWTWWYVAVAAARDSSGSFQVSPPERPGTGGDIASGVALGRELAARALKVPAINLSSLPGMAPNSPWPSSPSFAFAELHFSLSRLLSKEERQILNVSDEPSESLPARATAAADTTQESIRTVGALPSGFVADVLKQSGCSRPKPDIAGALVRFEGNKLAALQWTAIGLSAECTLAARAIIVAALLPSSAMTPGRNEFVVLPMQDAFLQCLAQDLDSGMAAPLAVGKPQSEGGATILPPKKTRNLSPVYPPGAMQAHVQGIVILEAEISPTGCVRHLKVLRGLPMGLDVAALRAVSEWAFTPTLLNGQPVPVMMTVTVQFTLQ